MHIRSKQCIMEHTNTKTKVVTKNDQDLLARAVGLIAYANTDKMFAHELAHLIQQQNWQTAEVTAQTATTYLTPTTVTDASTTATWLLALLSETKDTPATRAHLATWAADQEVPKNIIIGIIGISIMGPTLGILDEVKKKKKSQLQVVIENNYYKKLSKAELSKLSAQLGQQVFAHEVKLVGGNVYNLHPDSAEWYLSEPELKLYTVDSETLNELKAGAEKEGLTTQSEYKNDQLVALAISPSIDNALVEDYEAKLI